MGECNHGRFAKGLLVDRELDNHIGLFKDEILKRTADQYTSKGVILYSTQYDDLQVIDGGSGTATILPGRGVDTQGQIMEVVSDSTGHSVPDDSETYNVLIEYAYDDQQMGTYRSGFPVPGESGYTQRVSSFTITITQSDPTTDQILLATVSNTGGTLTIVDKRGESRALPYIPRHSVTEEMLGSPTPPAIPTRLTLSTGLMGELVATSPSESSHAQTIPGGFYVKAKWGQSGTGGVGGAGTFYVAAAGWTVNEWSTPDHQYLTDSEGESWEIASNTSDTLTLVESGTPADGGWIIGPDAPAYQVQLKVVDSANDPVQDFMVEKEIKVSDSPVEMYSLFPNSFELGTRVAVRIRSLNAWGKGRASAWTAWGYITCEIAKITDAPTNVSITERVFGVTVTCDSHSSSCTGIEVAYTLDGSAPSFSTSSVIRAQGFKVNIPADPEQLVKVKVRYVDSAGQPGTASTDAQRRAGRLNLDMIPDGETYKRLRTVQASAVDQAIAVGTEVSDARGTKDTLKEKMDELEEMTGGGVEYLYNQNEEADASAGSSVSSLKVWQENATSPYTKIIFALKQQPANIKRKYLKILGRAWMSGAATGYLRADIEWGGSSKYSGQVTITTSTEDDVTAIFDLDVVCVDNGVTSIPSDAVVKIAIYVTTLSINLTKVKAVVYGTSVLSD